MLRVRVIPMLLLHGTGLVKGVGFKNHRYIGDPINAVRIFNEKEVDELLLVDIDASRKGQAISHEFVRRVASECFMPLGVGGGIKTEDDAYRLFSAGAEKITVNTGAIENPSIVTTLAKRFGSQSIVGAIDVRIGFFGKRRVYARSGARRTSLDPVQWAQELERLGAGEILLTSIDRDGTMQGFDTELIRSVASNVSVPVIAAGGAGCLAHFADAVIHARASAVAAGSIFVFHGRRRAVLISFPSRNELEGLFAPHAAEDAAGSAR